MNFKIPFFNKKKYKSKSVRRGYNAGDANRLLSDWVSSAKSADSEIYGDIAQVRERARDLERNEPYVEKFLFELENNVIGDKGICFRSEPKNPVDGQLDRIAKEAIEWAWYYQNHPENYTVTKDLSGVDTDRLILRSIARDGELIIRIVKGYENNFAFSIQLLEPDQLDHHYHGEWNGNEIRMGIELNKWKVPVAYWIDTEHPGDYYQTFRSQGKTRIRVPANEILFPFRKNRAGQTRGISWIVTAMTHLKMLGGYEEAELVAARVSAAKMGFFETENGADYGPTDPDAPDEDFTMEVEAGLIDQLPAGMKFKGWDPQHPSTAFESFRKAMLRRICGGLTMSYNTLANDLEGVNYSSLRDGKLTERDGYKVIQNWLINSYKRPLFLSWLEHSLDFGLIKAAKGNGFALPASKLQKFAEHSFIPRRWPWVDPQKDATAMEILKNNNWKSDSQIIAEQGYDIDDVYSQIAEDEKLAESKGIQKIDTKEKSIEKMDTNDNKRKQ